MSRIDGLTHGEWKFEIDFHNPPLAAPTNTVMRPFSSTASSAAIRPLMVAEPIFRAGNPDTVAESKRYGPCARAGTAVKVATAKIKPTPVNPALRGLMNRDSRADARSEERRRGK